MTRLSVKHKITNLVYESLPEHSKYHGLSIDQIVFKWFVTGRTGSGLRLTEEGFKKFTEANLTHFDFTINHTITGIFKNPNIFAMSLNNHINCPYYLGVTRDESKSKVFLRIYDSKTAMMINLYGTVEEFIASQKSKNSRKSLI